MEAGVLCVVVDLSRLHVRVFVLFTAASLVEAGVVGVDTPELMSCNQKVEEVTSQCFTLNCTHEIPC